MHTILLVDDQPAITLTLRYLFDAHGYCVVRASTASEALSIARKLQFDVALVHFQRSGRNGLNVCRQLAEHVRVQRQAAGIWLMTESLNENSAVEAFEAGATRVLQKPFAPEQFLDDVDAFMSKVETTPRPFPGEAAKRADSEIKN